MSPPEADLPLDMPSNEPAASTQSQPKSGWQFKSDTQTQTSPATSTEVNPVEWSASEFIEHNKTSGWYLLLTAGSLALAAIVYLLTQDKISMAMVVIVAIIFGIFAARKPRVLSYNVDQSGVGIGEKLYPYAHFKSFSVVQEGAIDSIWLMPLKRFMPMLTIYFEPKDEDKIVNTLSHFLPVETHQLDAVDKLMHRLRF